MSDIIGSCGGLVAVLPHRPASEHGTSKYVLREIAIAQDQGLPCLVVAVPGVDQPGAIAAVDVETAVDEFSEDWREPRQRHYVFIATDFDQGNEARNSAIRQVVQCVTAMPCVLGRDSGSGAVQQEIVDRISGATVVIADITDGNLNTCIEAGVARGAGRPLYLLAKGPPARPAFMFRDREVRHYADEVELLGLVNAVVRTHRRRVIATGP